MNDAQEVAMKILELDFSSYEAFNDRFRADIDRVADIVTAFLAAEHSEIACLKNKIIELEANTASLVEAERRRVWEDVMIWTTDKPTKPGWYWWRTQGTEASVVRIIHTDEGGLIIQFETGHCTHLHTVRGEWSSTPVPEPEEQP